MRRANDDGKAVVKEAWASSVGASPPADRHTHEGRGPGLVHGRERGRHSFAGFEFRAER